MAVPESPIPAPALNSLMTSLAQLTEATKQQVAATLASAIIAVSGRTISIAQALEIVQDIRFAMYPMPGHGVYHAWEMNKDQKLNKVYGG